MNMEDFVKWLRKNFFMNKAYNERKMKRVFQWERYLEWKNLTADERLNARRIILIPIIAFPLLQIIKFYTPLILTALLIWLLYRHFEKGNITK